MKRIVIALAAASLLIVPATVSTAAPVVNAKPKCSVTDVKTQTTIDAAVKSAAKAEAKAKAALAKLQGQKAKAEATLKKVKDAKAAKVKTSGELKAKLLKSKNNIAAINKRITNLKGPALTKANKDLAAALAEKAELDKLVAAANQEVKEVTTDATEATETVSELVEEIEVVEVEAEEAMALVSKKKAELTKAKGKCTR